MKPDLVTESSGSEQNPGQPILSLTDLSVHFALGGSAVGRLFGRSLGSVKALDGVNLDAPPAERCWGWRPSPAAASNTVGARSTVSASRRCGHCVPSCR